MAKINNTNDEQRLEVLKTYKIYVGGQFPRTESGRYYVVKSKNGDHLANVCQCSRKDFRDAVLAARNAFGGWSARAAFNRGQILYRIAEMLEGRKSQFVDEMTKQGLSLKQANEEVNLSIERLIYYAGWCDKYHAMASTVNPVASSHFNFSSPEPTGVVSVLAPDDSPLLGLVSMMAPIISGGNTCVILASSKYPLSAVTFGEVLGTSDLSGGVVNILTGFVDELLPYFADHMDVNAITLSDQSESQVTLAKEKSVFNLKRVFQYKNINWITEKGQSPYFILDLQEIKTTWHPIENIGGAKASY